MKVVCSYTMFGHFYDVFDAVLRAHFASFAPWEFRLHHDEVIDSHPYGKVLRELDEHGLIKLVRVDRPPVLCKAMLWRMFPVWDPEVDVVFCRDLDALPTPRERMVDEEFIASPYPVHGINDHPEHTLPLMGGMIGMKTKNFINLSQLTNYDDLMLANYTERQWGIKGMDQECLMSLVWPRVRNHTMIHVLRHIPVHYSGPQVQRGVAHKDIPDIQPEVLQRGNSFCGFIGCINYLVPKQEIVDFYNEHANYKIGRLHNIEQKHGIGVAK